MERGPIRCSRLPTMLRAFRLAATDRHDHETAFLERYDHLYHRAVRLTGSHEQAGDLVQDAFVQFVLARTPLSEIRNLDAYLFTMLQYLHASEVRRSSRRPSIGLDLLEHDSAHIALGSFDPARSYVALEQLGLVCEYACARSATSKAATALLFRYFHGYYVREIALLFGCPPASVDGLLHVARREARTSVNAACPGRRAWSTSLAEQRNDGDIRRCQNGTACLDDLRSRIFARAHLTCFSRAWFEQAYTAHSRRQPQSSELAELATCARCLDQANTALGLPLLADRYPTDTLGPDRRSGGSAGPLEPPEGPPMAPGRPSAGRLTRQVQDVREHRPRELLLAVNGFPLASQKTGGRLNEQNVAFPSAEAIRFVEVFSEQQVRMLFLEVEPVPGGVMDQRRSIEMAGGRTLEAGVTFAERWPEIHVTYADPEADTALPAGETSPAAEPHAGRIAALPAHVEPAARPAAEPAREWSRIRDLAGCLLRPQTLPAVLAVLLLAFWALHAFGPDRTPSAAELLDRAIVSERTLGAQEGEVRHRVVHLEERRLDDGVVLGRTRIEIWEDASRGATARRAFDEATGRVLALELSTGSGPTTVYRRDRPPESAGPESSMLAAVLDAREPWLLALSTVRCAGGEGGFPGATVKRAGDAFVVRGRRSAATAGRDVVDLELTFAGEHLRLVNAVLVVGAAGGRREYRFTEQRDERLPAAVAGERAFELDPGLVLGKSTVSRTAPETPSPSVDARQIAALQVEALFLLDRAGATLGEQVSVYTEGAGIVVEALVADEARSRELLRALGPLAGNPAVRIDVQSLGEAARRRGQPRVPSLVRGVGATRDRVAAHDAIRRHVNEHAGPAWPAEGPERDALVEREVLRTGARVLETARRALLRAWALEHLVTLVPPEKAVSLEPPAVDRWWAMVEGHAAACRREAVALKKELAPILGRD